MVDAHRDLRASDQLDALIRESLTALSLDPLVQRWLAKEADWVSYFAFRHLVHRCRPSSVLNDPAQIAIEVGVPQPEGYKSPPRAAIS